MTIASDIANFHRERISEIGELITRSPGKWTVNDFHDLRVSLKKLRALLALVHFGAPHFPRKKTWRPFRLLFRQAGRVRELQLELQLLRELKLHRSLPLYFLRTQQRLRVELRAFHRVNGPWLRQKLEWMSGETEDFLGKVSENEMQEFLSDSAGRIRQVMAARHLSETELHELRKKLKVLLYLSVLSGKKTSLTRQADELQQVLGRWHDTVVIRNKLQDLSIHQASPGEQPRIQELIHRLERDAHKLLVQFGLQKEAAYRGFRRLNLQAA